MVFVTHPDFIFGGGENFMSILPAFLVALLSAISGAGVNICIRKLKGEPTATVTLAAMVGSIVVALPGFIYEVATDHDHALRSGGPLMFVQLSCTGLLSWMGQMLKTSGLQISRHFVSIAMWMGYIQARLI